MCKIILARNRFIESKCSISWTFPDRHRVSVRTSKGEILLDREFVFVMRPMHAPYRAGPIARGAFVCQILENLMCLVYTLIMASTIAPVPALTDAMASFSTPSKSAALSAFPVQRFPFAPALAMPK